MTTDIQRSYDSPAQKASIIKEYKKKLSRRLKNQNLLNKILSGNNQTLASYLVEERNQKSQAELIRDDTYQRLELYKRLRRYFNDSDCGEILSELNNDDVVVINTFWSQYQIENKDFINVLPNAFVRDIKLFINRKLALPVAVAGVPIAPVPIAPVGAPIAPIAPAPAPITPIPIPIPAPGAPVAKVIPPPPPPPPAPKVGGVSKKIAKSIGSEEREYYNELISDEDNFDGFEKFTQNLIADFEAKMQKLRDNGKDVNSKAVKFLEEIKKINFKAIKGKALDSLTQDERDPMVEMLRYTIEKAKNKGNNPIKLEDTRKKDKEIEVAEKKDGGLMGELAKKLAGRRSKINPPSPKSAVLSPISGMASPKSPDDEDKEEEMVKGLPNDIKQQIKKRTFEIDEFINKFDFEKKTQGEQFEIVKQFQKFYLDKGINITDKQIDDFLKTNQGRRELVYSIYYPFSEVGTTIYDKFKNENKNEIFSYIARLNELSPADINDLLEVITGRLNQIAPDPEIRVKFNNPEVKKLQQSRLLLTLVNRGKTIDASELDTIKNMKADDLRKVLEAEGLYNPRKGSGRGLSERGLYGSHAKKGFVKMGTKLIDLDSLKQGYLRVAYKSRAYVVGYQGKPISYDFAELLHNFILNDKFDVKDYKKLVKDERLLFDNLLSISKLSQQETRSLNKFKKDTDTARDKALKKLNVISGQLTAGNNNAQLIKEFKKLVIHCYNEKFISRADYNKALSILLMLD